MIVAHGLFHDDWVYGWPQVLGLDICADIIVGDEMKRGISGGQKKRVTTGMPASCHFININKWFLISPWNSQIIHYVYNHNYYSREIVDRGPSMKCSITISYFLKLQSLCLLLFSLVADLGTLWGLVTNTEPHGL